MQKYQDYIFSSPSVGLPRPVPNATVLVLNYPAMTVATIYSDNGITTTTNPFLSAGDGKIAFYAADGHYSVQVSGQGINGTPTTNDILLEDGPADFVTLSALAASSGSSLVGTIQTGTGAVLRTQQSKNRDFAHIKDYGAICDGVTDDTASINACLTANPNRTILASGIPLISSTITIANRQKLIFEGGPDFGITAPPASYFKKKSTMTTVGVLLQFGAFLEGGGVDCSTGATGDGVQLAGNNATCRNVTVFGFPAGVSGVGFRVGDVAGTNTNSWLLDGCNASSMGSHGFLIHDGSGAGPNTNAGVAIKCGAFSNGGDGFVNQNAALNTFLGCLSESNTGAGLRMASPANNNYIYGGDYEANGAGQIVLDAGSGRTTVSVGPNISVTDNSDSTIANTTVQLGRLIQKQVTFAPLLAGSSTAGTQTYSEQVGIAERFGDMMFVSIRISLSALDGATAGNMQITGVPLGLPAGFTNAAISFSIGQWGNFTLTAGYTQIGARLLPNTSIIQLTMGGSAQTAALITKAMASPTSQIYLSGCYPIAQF